MAEAWYSALADEAANGVSATRRLRRKTRPTVIDDTRSTWLACSGCPTSAILVMRT